MVPSTPIYGLPHEDLTGDVPGATLHGGDPPGSSPILAEAVEAELQRVDADVQAVDDRVTDLEGEIKPGTVVAKLIRNTAQPIPAATSTFIEFEAAPVDRLGGWSASNPTRYTPTVPGWYVVSGMVGYGSAAATTDLRRAAIRKNGGALDGGFRQQAPAQTVATQQVAAATVPVEMNGSTDYLELEARSTAATDTTTGTTTPYLSVIYSGPSV